MMIATREWRMKRVMVDKWTGNKSNVAYRDVFNVDPHLSSVEEQSTDGVGCCVRKHEWNAAIECHGVVQLILKYIEIVEAVWINTGVAALHVCAERKDVRVFMIIVRNMRLKAQTAFDTKIESTIKVNNNKKKKQITALRKNNNNNNKKKNTMMMMMKFDY
jgi:hypothetical protein